MYLRKSFNCFNALKGRSLCDVDFKFFKYTDLEADKFENKDPSISKLFLRRSANILMKLIETKKRNIIINSLTFTGL